VAALSDDRLAAAALERIAVGGGWSGWRLCCLRSAGFPAEWVLPLASPELAALADQLIALEGEIASQFARAVEEPREAGANEARQKKALRALRRQLLPSPEGLPPRLEARVRALALARERAEALRAQLAARFAVEGERIGRILRQRAGEPRFREALVWQNRRVLDTAVRPLERSAPGATDKHTRDHERMVASYLQRYCLKNDTIGFFGPVGWACVDAEAPALAATPGPSLLAARDPSIEYWAVDALAELLADDGELRVELAPRRHPTVRIEGTTLHHPIERSSELPVTHARALALADGVRPARQIAAELCADPTLGLADTDEAYALLDELREQRLLLWTLEVPTTGAHPERTLRTLLAALPPSPARDRALGVVDELDAARRALAHAAGDPVALESAAARLEETFARITGRGGARRGGETYAGRTLYYEDCRRDVAVTLGPALLDALAPPLTLLLDSARWYTYSVAARYQQLFRDAFAELSASRGGGAVDYLRFWERVAPHFPNSNVTNAEPVRAVAAELRARWAALLGGLSGARVLKSAAELRPLVEAAFPAPHAGWPSARYHTPDLMIASPSVEAAARGDFQIVLGEVHVSMHTYSMSTFLYQHPRPESIVAGRERDVPEPCVMPVTPRALATRADHVWLTGHNFDLEIGDARSFRPRDQVLAVADLVVDERDGQLQVRSHDGARRFPILAFFEYYLMGETMNHFSLLPSAPHTPRLTVDRVVLEREKWRFTAEALGFAHAEDAPARFLAARRWAREQGLPRHVFARAPEEPKPIFVDFESPSYVDLFVRLARRASQLIVSEMLPAFGQHWLRDGGGAAYSAELRIACVDGFAWQPLP